MSFNSLFLCTGWTIKARRRNEYWCFL